MAFPRGSVRRHAVASLSAPASFSVFLSVLLGASLAPRPAEAGKNDLALINLCPLNAQGECSWVQRDADNKVRPQLKPDSDAFRSLMSELGVVVAPRLQTPADTLGYSGFQFSAEFGMTKISHNASYWNGVAGVAPQNPNATRPDAYLTTVGGFVRKGMWLPFPALEFGAGVVNILGSSLFALQGYAKIALQEGFHDWALPSVAIRGSASQLLGTDQVDLTVLGVDLIISKAFSLAGTARFEPFAGASELFIDARSGAIDGTPACDAYLLEHTTGTPSPPCMQQTAGPEDYNANFTFPRQDIITRNRFFVGFKLKLAVLFLTGEYALVPAGRSHDDMQAGGAADQSGRQQSFSFSAGFDF